MSVGARFKLVVVAAAIAVGVGGALMSAGAGAASSRTYPSSACPQADGPAGGLEQCIAASAPGDTIKVKPGTYFENDIDVTKKITIEGYPCEDDDPAVIDAAPPRPPAAGVKDHGFDVQADDVTLRCLTIRHAISAVFADQVAPVNNLRVDRLSTIDGSGSGDVDVSGDGYRIENSLFNGTNTRAIDADGNNGRVLNNRARLVGNECFQLVGNGLLVEGNTATLCEDEDGFEVRGDDNTIRKNTASLADANGFEIVGANPVVEKNKATGGFGNDGFNINCSTTCHKGRVVGNSAQGSNDDDQGFDITVNPTVTPCSTVPFPCFRVTGNTSTLNNAEGFLFLLSRSLISGNKVTLNGSEDEPGFELASSDDNLIEGNLFEANSYDGLRIDNSNGNTIRENTAIGNGVDGIHLRSGTGNTLDANEAEANAGDGIENDGTATTITDNTSSENRADCVGDVLPASSSGNDCEDGSDFTTGGTIDE